MKVFRKALPNATLSGCFFHISQNFIRKISELRLKNLYRSNPELSLALKLIPALAFENLEKVKSSFKLVVENIQEVCERLSLNSSEVEKIDELCSYFQNTYIEKNLRESLFPHRYGTKEKLHRKALLELQMRLKVGILASKRSFGAHIQVCGERWKTWRRMLPPKSISICSQQQVRSFRGEKSTENWRRSWKTQLNVIRMKI